MEVVNEGTYTCAGHILIVDDLSNWREALAEVLTADGQTVYTAADPTQALEIVAQKPVDVVILDLRLKDKDFYNVQGVNLLREIRTISPRIRIFMMTGFPSAGLLDKIAIVYDVDAFWLKNPVDQQFDIDDFRRKIQLLIERARQHDVAR